MGRNEPEQIIIISNQNNNFPFLSTSKDDLREPMQAVNSSSFSTSRESADDRLATSKSPRSVPKEYSPVMCLYTEGNYTKIYLSNKTYFLVRSTLSGALKKLPPDMFIKTHRSLAASIYFIDNIAKDHLIAGEEPVSIARQYYKSVIEKLNIIM